MKLYAQDGFGPGEKIHAGISRGFIQGAVLSARYRHPGKFEDKAESLVEGAGDLFMDPEYYSIHVSGSPNAKLGCLEEWPYFTAPRRSQLITGQAVGTVIQAALNSQKQFNQLSGLISPNIYVESADSIDAGIALNFAGQVRSIANLDPRETRPVYATLALDRDVFHSLPSFRDLLSALTALPARPDGFYLLVGSGSNDVEARNSRSELYHDHVIAGWMLMNYALSINGLKVINGCADLLSPLLGIAGAEACATGWSNNLRQFTLKRYIKPPNQGGSVPLVKYVSNSLLSRIKQTDFFAFAGFLPEVENHLESDQYYDPETEETSRQEECLQSWNALSSLCEESISGDISDDLAGFRQKIVHAEALWAELAGSGLSSGVEAQLERLAAMRSAIGLFKEWAEIP